MSREWWLAAVEIWLSLMQQGQECKSRCEYFLSRICSLEVLLLTGFVAEPQMLQSSLRSTSLYFRPPLAMIYVLDLVWRFSRKTWSTGISAGKHETLLISHGCEWNVEESIKLVGWHWNLNWRLQLNCKWIIAGLWMWNLLYTLFTKYTRQHCYHKWALTLHKSLSLDELLLFLSKLDSLLVT